MCPFVISMSLWLCRISPPRLFFFLYMMEIPFYDMFSICFQSFLFCFVRGHQYCILKTRKCSIAKETNKKVLNTDTLKHLTSFTWQEPEHWVFILSRKQSLSGPTCPFSRLDSIVHSLNQYLLNTSCVPGTYLDASLGTVKIPRSHTGTVRAFTGLTSGVGTGTDRKPRKQLRVKVVKAG